MISFFTHAEKAYQYTKAVYLVAALSPWPVVALALRVNDFLSGVMLGVLFYMLNKLFGHLGLLNTWPPVLVAAMPSLLVLSVALLLFLWPAASVSIQLLAFSILSLSSLALWRLKYAKQAPSSRVGQSHGDAIGQMDQVTQQNAALVEEAAAAAQSLEEQAKQLVRAVSVFRLGHQAGGGLGQLPAPTRLALTA